MKFGYYLSFEAEHDIDETITYSCYAVFRRKTW
ncbi:MAG: hypothetical protein ACD_45C00020G0001, partial [uncultured bacterium]